MSRLTAWTIHCATLVLFATGIWLAWLTLFATEVDDFDPELFEMQPDWHPWLVAVHILVAPLLLFATGVVWMSHVRGRLLLGLPERRRTGLLLAGVLFPMVGCGYLLQVTDAETARTVLSWAHAGLGVAFGTVYGIHQLGPRATPPTPVS